MDIAAADLKNRSDHDSDQMQHADNLWDNRWSANGDMMGNPISDFLAWKWIVLAITIAGAVLAIIAAYLLPPKAGASVELRPIGPVELNIYGAFNNLNVQAGNVRAFSINAEKLLELFAQDLVNRKSIYEAIVENGLIDTAGLTSEQARSKILDAAYQVSFTEPVSLEEAVALKIRNPVKYWTLSMSSEDPETLQKTLYAGLEKSNAGTQIQLRAAFENFVNEERATNKRTIEDLERKLELDEQKYDFQIRSHVAVLKENIKQARAQDLAGNSLEAVSLDQGIIAIKQTETPLFLRGYKALEAELESTQKRTDKTVFIDGYAETAIEIARLKSDPRLTRLREEFARTPVMQDDFRAARFSLNSIVVQSPTSRWLFALLGGVLAFILVTGFIVGRRLLQDTKSI